MSTLSAISSRGGQAIIEGDNGGFCLTFIEEPGAPIHRYDDLDEMTARRFAASHIRELLDLDEQARREGAEVPLDVWTWNEKAVA